MIIQRRGRKPMMMIWWMEVFPPELLDAASGRGTGALRVTTLEVVNAVCPHSNLLAKLTWIRHDCLRTLSSSSLCLCRLPRPGTLLSSCPCSLQLLHQPSQTTLAASPLLPTPRGIVVLLACPWLVLPSSRLAGDTDTRSSGSWVAGQRAWV